tara:strand:- start:91 stop:522 length:432 start_codon:yes stop_codon:yes gene_type:complete
MKMYRSLKDLPSHKAGDILIENSVDYSWSEAPFFHINKQEVEEFPEWYELIVDDWENGETFYYVSTDFQIVDAEFNAQNHHRLVLNGNAFKEKDEAMWVSTNINRLLKDEDLVLTDNNEIKKIISLLKTNGIEKAIKLLMDML